MNRTSTTGPQPRPRPRRQLTAHDWLRRRRRPVRRPISSRPVRRCGAATTPASRSFRSSTSITRLLPVSASYDESRPSRRGLPGCRYPQLAFGKCALNRCPILWLVGDHEHARMRRHRSCSLNLWCISRLTTTNARVLFSKLSVVSSVVKFCCSVY